MYAIRSYYDGAEADAAERTLWPQADTGTSVAGLVGGLLTLFVAAAGALILKKGAAERE